MPHTADIDQQPAAVHIAYRRQAHHSNELLLDLYKSIAYPRIIEERMLKMLRLNKISKWFSGIGQEAIAVAVGKALHANEYILPMHRNLGVFTTRNIPFDRLFMQWEGKAGGFTNGRDRSFHFGTNDYHIVGMISHLGPQLAVGSGIALADLLRHNPKVTVAFTGEGGTSEGDFHEALNVAAVWGLPIIFVIENNGYGLSTPTSEQYKCQHLIDRAKGYGMEGVQIDGNNLLEMYDTLCELAESVRQNPRPILVEAITFRMRGHEEASGTKYVPKELLEAWEKKDPVINFRNFLYNENVLTPEVALQIEKEFKKTIDAGLDKAFNAPDLVISREKETGDVYCPPTAYDNNNNNNDNSNNPQLPESLPPTTPKSSKRFVEAITDGLRQAMEIFPQLVLMGQDIAEYGGAFKITDGFVQQFGKSRVRNTPICESAIVGIGLGLSIKGYKAMVEMQFADFVTCGFNQIVNNLAKSHYRWGQNADVVVRMPTGGTVGAGPFHSQSNEAWFFKVPGLKIVYPTTPYDAKGLLLAALNDPNPVLFFEHKALYRSISEDIPDQAYTVPIGKARQVRTGNDLSIITYGLGVYWAEKALDENPRISADLIDLRTLLPLDNDAIFASVKKTGKALILHEDSLTGGVGGEIAALISQHCFEYLDAPVTRCAALDTPIPFAISLEKQYMPEQRFKAELLALFEY